MAYRIDYTEKGIRKSVRRHRSWNRKAVTAVMIAALLSGLLLFRRPILRFLTPGDDVVTAAAAQNMIVGLKKGQSFRDAAITFCREVIDGAKDKLTD